MALLNITEYVSGEEDQVAQHHENKTSLQWWNCDMKPVNKAGKNSQYERYHQRHLLRWCEWPVKHGLLPGADEVNAGADYESPDGGLMTLAGGAYRGNPLAPIGVQALAARAFRAAPGR